MKLDYNLDLASDGVVITSADLAVIMPMAGNRVRSYVGPINAAMKEWQIDSPMRAAGWLANLAHESGSLQYARELADGSAYEGSAQLGNSEPGDGPRFKGRGLIQITGRHNYRSCSVAIYGDPEILLDNPEILESPTAAASSAGWFWADHGLNGMMDMADFRGCCSIINTGRPDSPANRINGWDQRLMFYTRACQVLGC